MVVGESTVAQDGSIIGSHATLWGSDGVPVDLGTLPGYEWANAWAIGDNGWIIGSASRHGDWRTVLWTPVPEPTSLLSFLGAIAGLSAILWRRTAWPRPASSQDATSSRSSQRACSGT